MGIYYIGHRPYIYIIIIYSYNHPNATSRLIITTKPKIAPQDGSADALSPPPFCASGTKSLTTTKIMAPAAKPSAYGNTDWAWETTSAPNTPATGSTIPESCPMKKLLNLLIPAR